MFHRQEWRLCTIESSKVWDALFYVYRRESIVSSVVLKVEARMEVWMCYTVPCSDVVDSVARHLGLRYGV